MLAHVLAAHEKRSDAIAPDLVATILGTNPEDGPNRVLTALELPPGSDVPAWCVAAVARVADAAKGDQRSRLAAHETVQRCLEAARKTSQNSEAPIASRREAIALVAGPFGTESDRDALGELLSPQSSPEIQNAIVEALASSDAQDVPQRLLAGWSGHLPQLRETILQTLLTRPAWTAALLDAADEGTLTAGDFSAAARERLTSSPNDTLRKRSAKLFGASLSSDRTALVAEYESAATTTGDAARGRTLFEKSCASCHKLAGIGNNFGPNLVALTDKSPQALLVSLLDPNRAVEAKYRGYNVVTRDGRVLTGLIVQESSSAITLAGADGRTTELLRKEIDELHDSGKSFMPEGLERDLMPQDVADVLAFVRTAGE